MTELTSMGACINSSQARLVKVAQRMAGAFLLVVGFLLLAGSASAATLKVGDEFPLEKLTQDKAAADNVLVAFMPSLTSDCEYASMLTQSFYYYFDRQLAFAADSKKPVVRVFLVVRDEPDARKSSQNIIGNMQVLFDGEGQLFSTLGANLPAGKNADTTVVLLDAQSKIVHLDEHYRAQGEHLKPLEHRIKELNGINRQTAKAGKKLKVGAMAPDFSVDGKTKLSDLRGNVVLVSFYPAAFSGILPTPKPDLFGRAASAPPTLQGSLGADFSRQQAQALMACAFQIDGLDTTSETSAKARRLVVSSSTKPLLEQWRQLLGTQNIEYVNDADYSVSAAYGSYNPNGYNNRVSVIIDRRGRIAYIDESFDFNDEAVLNTKIAELLAARR